VLGLVGGEVGVQAGEAEGVVAMECEGG